MTEITKGGTTRRSVLVSFAVSCAETLGLAAAAWVTGSAALRAQTAASAADVAVQVFLLIGVLSSVRPPDETHPLGYGRERFFWSLFAALGIFVGGGVLGIDEAVRSALHPAAVRSYPAGVGSHYKPALTRLGRARYPRLSPRPFDSCMQLLTPTLGGALYGQPLLVPNPS